MPAAHNNENAEPNSSLLTQPHTETSFLSVNKPVPQDSPGFTFHGPGVMPGDNGDGTSTQPAVQVQQRQHTTPRRRRGGWATPQPVPDQPLAGSTHTADDTATAGLANGAKQEQQVTFQSDCACFNVLSIS